MDLADCITQLRRQIRVHQRNAAELQARGGALASPDAALYPVFMALGEALCEQQHLYRSAALGAKREAMAAFNRALHISHSLHQGQPHPDTVRCLAALSALCVEIGDANEAAELSSTAVKYMRHVHGNGALRLSCHVAYASALRAQGNPDAGLDVLRKHLATLSGVPDQAGRRQCLVAIAEYCVQTSDYALAAQHHSQLLSASSGEPALGEVARAQAQSQLAHCLLALRRRQKYPDCKRLLEEAMPVLAADPGKTAEHRIASARYCLVLQRLGDVAQAKELLLKAFVSQLEPQAATNPAVAALVERGAELTALPPVPAAPGNPRSRAATAPAEVPARQDSSENRTPKKTARPEPSYMHMASVRRIAGAPSPPSFSANSRADGGAAPRSTGTPHPESPIYATLDPAHFYDAYSDYNSPSLEQRRADALTASHRSSPLHTGVHNGSPGADQQQHQPYQRLDPDRIRQAQAQPPQPHPQPSTLGHAPSGPYVELSATFRSAITTPVSAQGASSPASPPASAAQSQPSSAQALDRGREPRGQPALLRRPRPAMIQHFASRMRGGTAGPLGTVPQPMGGNVRPRHLAGMARQPARPEGRRGPGNTNPFRRAGAPASGILPALNTKAGSPKAPGVRRAMALTALHTKRTRASRPRESFSTRVRRLETVSGSLRQRVVLDVIDV